MLSFLKRLLLTGFIAFSLQAVYAQQSELISPSTLPKSTKPLHSDLYRLNWYMQQDTLKRQIGEVYTEIKDEGENNILIITKVKIPQIPTDWIDSTIVSKKDFHPIYHSSFNHMRDMILNFNQKVDIYYFDKQKKEKTETQRDIEGSYFDSNFYPHLVSLLPLEEGYTAKINIFDYNPQKKIGLMNATIKKVKSSILNYDNKKVKVWEVLVTDDISDNKTINTFYFDKKSRKLLKQEIKMGERTIVFERN